MDITKMRYFLSVVNQGSISKAAKVLGVSQQSMSNAMKSLEEEIGTDLLVRGNKGISLTRDGEIFDRYAIEIWATYEKMMNALNLNQTVMKTERLRVGTVKAFTMSFLPPFIIDFMYNNPNIKLKVYSESFRDVLDGIVKGSLDCGIVFRFRGAGSDLENFGWNFDVRHLASCKGYCWVSSKSEIALQHNIGFDQLSKLQTVALEDIDIDYLEAFYGAHGVELFDFPLATEVGMISELVAHNLAVCPDIKIGSKDPSMARMFSDQPVTPVAVRFKAHTKVDAVVVTKRDGAPSQAVETLVKALTRYAGSDE